jgi:prepilin-type N-terminal cleavage/methylation domain-containing protein
MAGDGRLHIAAIMARPGPQRKLPKKMMMDNRLAIG